MTGQFALVGGVHLCGGNDNYLPRIYFLNDFVYNSHLVIKFLSS